MLIKGKYWGFTGEAYEGVATEDYYIYGQFFLGLSRRPMIYLSKPTLNCSSDNQ